MYALGPLPGEFSVSQRSMKGIEAGLATACWKPAETMPSLGAEAKAATIIKSKHSFAILLKQKEFGEKSVFLES